MVVYAVHPMEIECTASLRGGIQMKQKKKKKGGGVLSGWSFIIDLTVHCNLCDVCIVVN